MKKILFVCVFVLAYIFVFAGLAYLVDRLFKYTYQYSAMTDLVIVSVNVIMFGVFMFYRARTRDAWIEAEADKWLRSRPHEQRNRLLMWRKNLRRKLLWLPTCIVLIASLFLPEIAGITSHAWYGRSLNLQRYQFKTPLTWVLETDGHSDCWAYAFQGMARAGFNPYLRQEPPMAEIHFYASPHPDADTARATHYLSRARVLSHRSISFGGRKLDCWETIPADPLFRPPETDNSFVDVICETDSYDFWAHFSGFRMDATAFYETLQNVRVSK
jgi:hypothetical protein